MSSSRVQKNLQGYSSLSTKLGLNSNTGHVNSFDDNNNPQLFSEPNVTTRNRFKALENLCDDSCAKEENAAFDDEATMTAGSDEEENYENEEGKKTLVRREQEEFLEQVSKIVLGVYRPK